MTTTGPTPTSDQSTAMLRWLAGIGLMARSVASVMHDDDGLTISAAITKTARGVAGARTLPPPQRRTQQERTALSAVLRVVARAAREAASGAPAGMVAVYVAEEASEALAALDAEQPAAPAPAPWPCPNPADPEGCYCPGDGDCVASAHQSESPSAGVTP